MLKKYYFANTVEERAGREEDGGSKGVRGVCLFSSSLAYRIHGIYINKKQKEKFGLCYPYLHFVTNLQSLVFLDSNTILPANMKMFFAWVLASLTFCCTPYFSGLIRELYCERAVIYY